ncbi:MAG: hypothetical protein E7586_00130 [Ruminococcaceae bacterium]|nr:hypothetical protein [Oscillospiraceae bacterium]
MKKGILCILLSLLMILPLLTACNKEVDLTGTEVSVYTLYTIVDEATSPEAIRQVELSLNRILFYRLGVILDLQMVTEDEYDEFINGKLTELDDYLADKENNPYAENIELYPGVMTGDRVLDILENDEDIVLKRPRVDIFLVRGYDDYYKLASEEKLAQLDEKLNNEGKELKSAIHTTLRDAVKVNNKTYGIPINTAIGEYSQLVFDKELLEKYNVNLDTIKTLEDLEDYLGKVKADNTGATTDVVPLLNTIVPSDINFIVNEGFPALVTNGEVIDAYSNKKLQEFFTLLAKFNAKGYISEDVSEDARCAVRIEMGTKDEIKNRLADTGYEYEFVQYSAPIATTENTIKNIFCIPASVVSNELTDVVKIINEINTDADLMNLLTYGIEKTHGVEIAHYELNDKNQVERIKDNPYIVDPQYIGNCFITHTLDGESPNKWNDQIEQNKLAIPSPSLGFTMPPMEFTYYEEVVIEDDTTDTESEEPKTETQLVTITEPDYIAIINEIVNKYYPSLMYGELTSTDANGNTVEFDYEKLVTDATAEVEASLISKLDDIYEKNVLTPIFSERYRDQIIASQGAALRKDAEAEILKDDAKEAKKFLKKELKKQLEADNPEASKDEITDMLNTTLTDDYVIEHINEYYDAEGITAEDIAERVEEEYLDLIEDEVSASVKANVGTGEYNRLFQELKNSDKYKQDLDSMMKFDLPIMVQNKVDSKLSAMVKATTTAMVDEINVAIETAVEDFITEYSEKLGKTREEILLDIGYLVKQAVAEDGETSDTSDTSDVSDASDVDSSEVETTEDASDVETTEVESTEETSVEIESSEVVSSEVESSATESSDAETSEGEAGEEGETNEVVVEVYPTWLDFVVKGKVATAYYTLHPQAK